MRKRHVEPSYDADLGRVRDLLEDMARLGTEMLDDSLNALAARDSAEMVIFLVRGEDVRHRGRLPAGERSP
jgi:phosphate uptake regulator